MYVCVCIIYLSIIPCRAFLFQTLRNVCTFSLFTAFLGNTGDIFPFFSLAYMSILGGKK